ncbi:sensor histidine kinase [Tahibacter caeni]|uniref:sensor histidine kinase n=1 Tax=Tahibacter caeni TaxID=1453545 RepID=UPI0021473A87|nr:histidine kinase dimerization/phospho-acceptor domain-containing protein [Tahibacter caeni]
MTEPSASANTVRPAWSLHRRLALGLALSIGGTFALLFPLLDRWIDREIYARMDLTLLQRATAVGRVLQESDPRRLERLMPEYEPEGHTEFFTLFDEASGQPVLRSPSSGGAALPPGPAKQGTPRYFDVVLPDGHAGRALATHVPMPGAKSRLLVVATEREGWDRTERHVHLALLAGIALATLIATCLALLLVQRVIVALRRAGAKAASLQADTPTQRIDGDFPRELQPFADAFNLGLHHLYAAIERERRFSRDVAHELRTPLAEIRTSAESALADDDGAQARRSLAAAVAACSRMQRSVDTLLLLARLESGQHTPAPDPLDLAALLRELLAAVHGLQTQRGLQVCMELPPSAWIRSDLGIVERILSNLLRNALEYSPPGEQIRCRLDRDESGWLLSIVNAAPELDAADLDHFGHRFWRKHSEGGTAHHAGLGLALAFALARAVQLPLRFRLDAGRLTAQLGPWPALA